MSFGQFQRGFLRLLGKNTTSFDWSLKSAFKKDEARMLVLQVFLYIPTCIG